MSVVSAFTIIKLSFSEDMCSCLESFLNYDFLFIASCLYSLLCVTRIDDCFGYV